MSRQRLGQHFLSDAGWRARIAQAMEIGAATRAPSHDSLERVWLEVGAGHGEMTRLLAASGAHVIAVELDPRLLRDLQDIERECPGVQIIAGDILSLDLAEITEGHRFSVYGNLPYYITSPILHRVFECAAAIEEIYIVVQFEVAARLTARPGTSDYGYLSVFTQYHAKPEIVLRIPRGAFRPPPKVTSALVHLRPPGERANLGLGDEGRFFEFVKQCFAQKRKKLTNNLRALATPEAIGNVLRDLGIRSDARAEQLSVAQFAQLYQRLIPSRFTE
ncbi:MAG TPA: 16S rRNA (adenine(1518)-N(6)/adenine(1519)-N(6))-dimethyltransferase RsmA [Candidatus Acidoferrales bacterium]|nr:16S rRNA (adenine(1518)-N(6)/adenine(1519)-N(6))-dimethyltransferase RsmA [Candidatus Acidoferrales bacterium]